MLSCAAGAAGVVDLPDAAALDAALADRRATGEADTYAAVVDDYFADPETRRKERHSSARRAAFAAARIREELSPYRTAPAAGRIRTVAEFLRRHERTPDAEAPGADRFRRARAAILGILDELASACDGAEDVAVDPTAWIRHAIEARTFAPRRGSAGVHLVDAGAARFGDFDHVHLVGLVETDWPERAVRNIFYTSGLLEPLGWTAYRDHTIAELATFRDLLGLARQTTTLHAFKLEADAVVARSPVIDLTRDRPATAPPALTVPPRVFADEVLSEAFEVEGLEAGTSAWLAARRARPGPGSRRYRGHIDAQPARPYRVNRVERYAICPFKYFGETILGLPEERDTPEGLTPLERGTLVHALLEAFYREWQARGGRAITPATLEAAETLFESLVRSALAELPPGDRALEEARLLGSIVTPGLSRKVFDLELSGPDDVTERLLEVALDGTYVFPAMWGLKTREIEIRAKADRLDVFADGSLRVVDYKLGRPPDADTTLQVAVYAHAARAWCEARDGRTHRVRDALYLAFGDERDARSSGSLRGSEATADEGVTTRVGAFADAVERIEAGAFPARPSDPAKCAYCGVAGVCRKEYWTEADEAAESV
jgi:RecB family exonuclease